MYVDEGLSGTMMNKRVNFLKMIDDAKAGMFSLIITREVSRFARNTVDTLVCTRKLKKYGVEVWFIEDNIHTFNDEDGELKLTLLATLAQNESKKISVRVKAGQHISYLNGVFYGTGNILGYERVGRELVINEKQAEIVRTIFDLYNSGEGLKKICYELERRGYPTQSGTSKWQVGTLSYIIQNPFYCGKIVYRKSYVQNYLEHKRVMNQGEVEQVVVDGTHQPIVSVETFETAQRILQSKISYQRNHGKGQKLSEDVWVRKMRCCCGRTFARRMWHRKSEDGTGQLTYRCRSQMETGSIQTRRNHGLSTEGVCDTPWVQRWKLEVMLWTLFKHLWQYRDMIIDNAMEALKGVLESDETTKTFNQEKQSAVYERQLDNLLDLYLEGGITKEKYLDRKKKIEFQRNELQDRIKCVNINNAISIESRIQNICKITKESFDERTMSIPDELIDVFVEKIIVHKDYFEWYINCSDNAVRLQLTGNKRKHQIFDSVSSTDKDYYPVDTVHSGGAG